MKWISANEPKKPEELVPILLWVDGVFAEGFYHEGVWNYYNGGWKSNLTGDAPSHWAYISFVRIPIYPL